MLFEKIKADRIQAMKDKDTLKRDLLGVLVGEASKDDKNPDDTKVIAVIRKFIKNAQELQVKAAGASESTVYINKAYQEITILESYIPKQLSAEAIKKAIEYMITLGEVEKSPKAMGLVMKALGEKYPGQIDGKIASAIVREALQ